MFSPELIAAATVALETLRQRQQRLVTAESCTGGLITALLTEIAGSSDVVDGGFVTYSNAAKSAAIGVDESLLARHGAVSAEVAEAMALGALQASAAEISVSVTGIAGPGGGSPMKPVGLVYISAMRRGRAPITREHRFGDIGRSGIRLASVRVALDLINEVSR